MNTEFAPAKVNDSQLEKIRNLEQNIGKVIVAIEPKQQFARLTQDQLNELRTAEQELGVVMVAYES
jgi:hypothetical protein